MVAQREEMPMLEKLCADAQFIMRGTNGDAWIPDEDQVLRELGWPLNVKVPPLNEVQRRNTQLVKSAVSTVLAQLLRQAPSPCGDYWQRARAYIYYAVYHLARPEDRCIASLTMRNAVAYVEKRVIRASDPQRLRELCACATCMSMRGVVAA